MSMQQYRRGLGSTYYSSFGHAAGSGLLGGTFRGAVAGYQQGAQIHPAIGLALAAVRAPVQGVTQSVGNVLYHARDKVTAQANVGMHDSMMSALAHARSRKPGMAHSIKNAQFEAKHRRVHGKFA